MAKAWRDGADNGLQRYLQEAAGTSERLSTGARSSLKRLFSTMENIYTSIEDAVTQMFGAARCCDVKDKKAAADRRP